MEQDIQNLYINMLLHCIKLPQHCFIHISHLFSIPLGHIYQMKQCLLFMVKLLYQKEE